MIDALIHNDAGIYRLLQRMPGVVTQLRNDYCKARVL